jgi:hypothetical protein
MKQVAIILATILAIAMAFLVSFCILQSCNPGIIPEEVVVKAKEIGCSPQTQYLLWEYGTNGINFENGEYAVLCNDLYTPIHQ